MGDYTISEEISDIYRNGEKVVALYKNSELLWEKPSTSPTNYLIFDSDTAFTLAVTTPKWDGVLYTSTDAVDWTEWDGTSVSSSSSGILYMCGTGNTTICYTSTYNKFTFSGATNMECNGNIESLLDWETVANGEHPTMGSSCYRQMFRSCTALTTAPSLPATTVTSNCYQYMFYGCTSLTTAPSLPATTVWACSYQYMFNNCTALTTPPNLPATALATSCYSSMFKGCTSLKISETYTSELYKYEWKIPTSGTISSTTTNWNAGMLYGTGGTFKDTLASGEAVTINTTYYTTNEPV